MLFRSEEEVQPMVESHYSDSLVDATSLSSRSFTSQDRRELQRQILSLRAEMEHLHAIQEEFLRERDDLEYPPDYDDVFSPR